jgi:hypothetical protein
MKRANASLSSPTRHGARWQPFSLGVASAGTSIGMGVLHPSVGVAFVIVELSVALTIVATALFGTNELSDRAFRLLGWIDNRPEPSSHQEARMPSPGQPDGGT